MDTAQRIAKILKLTLHEMSLRRQRLPAAGLNLGTEPVQRFGLVVGGVTCEVGRSGAWGSVLGQRQQR